MLCCCSHLAADLSEVRVPAGLVSTGLAQQERVCRNVCESRAAAPPGAASGPAPLVPLSIKLHLADNREFEPEVNVNCWVPTEVQGVCGCLWNVAVAEGRGTNRRDLILGLLALPSPWIRGLPELWLAGSGWERSLLCLSLTKIAKLDLAWALGDEAWCYSWLVPEPAVGMSGAALDKGTGAGRELL